MASASDQTGYMVEVIAQDVAATAAIVLISSCGGIGIGLQCIAFFAVVSLHQFLSVLRGRRVERKESNG